MLGGTTKHHSQDSMQWALMVKSVKHNSGVVEPSLESELQKYRALDSPMATLGAHVIMSI